MRRLYPPTLVQWGCQHQWKTTTSRPGMGDIVRVRYLTCRSCNLKVKTEERLAVPWTDADLVVQVRGLLPEEQAVALRDKGITELLLARLNAIMARHGLMIHVTKGSDPTSSVPCRNKDGQVEPYGHFELRRIPQ